jgi:hypothetical protein
MDDSEAGSLLAIAGGTVNFSFESVRSESDRDA